MFAYITILEWTFNTVNPTFNYSATPEYSVTVSCQDSTTAARTAVLTVKVVAKDLLQFTSLPGNQYDSFDIIYF